MIFSHRYASSRHSFRSGPEPEGRRPMCRCCLRQHVPFFRIPSICRPPAAARSPWAIGCLIPRSCSRHRGMPQASSRAVQREPAQVAACAARPFVDVLQWMQMFLSPTEKPSMRKLPARCVSSSTGEPTRSSPTMAFSRASVTSSREGSGVCGAKSPSCTLLDCPASR